MPCKHTEDVCQRCLQKVQTEEAPQISPPRKTCEEAPQISPPRKTCEYKTPKILLESAFLVGVGYTAYYSGKLFLGVFNFGVAVAKDLLKTILTSGEV